MNESILKYLQQIQQQKGIEILLACETGSRAWGFPSPDSDYDVRFIYRHKKDWYLSLNQQKDSIEEMFENNEIDLSGWDLRKSLHLLWKSNPPLLERIQSPIVYMVNDQFVSDIYQLAQQAYSKVATMHHYLSMAKKMYAEIKDQEEVKLKKLFYVLRSSVACRWIEEKEAMPPIVFQTMLEELATPEDLKQKIYDLIALKATKNEDYLHKKESQINAYIEHCIAQADAVAASLPSGKAKIEDLNTFFINNLK